MKDFMQIHHELRQKQKAEIQLRFPSLDVMQVANLMDAFVRGDCFVLDWIKENLPSLSEHEQLKEDYHILKQDLIDNDIYSKSDFDENGMLK